MARRTLEIDGERWQVFPSGRVTVYSRDEFGLVFQKGSGRDRVRRFVRYSPVGARRRDVSLAGLSEARLTEFFRQSQGEWTSPEARLTSPSA